jgi:coenzyme PQQ precursor peptide PqqA
MNAQIEIWIAPDFEDVSLSMECTAYAGTQDEVDAG